VNSAHEFARLYQAAKALESEGFRAGGALATITRTRGSTYRRAGTSMLLRADGRIVCPLAGGCPQHDIVRRAEEVIASDTPQLARYDRENGLDVLIETGCEGELEVLIEPLASVSDLAFLEVLAHTHRQRACGWLATVYARDGAALIPRPQRLFFDNGGYWSDIDDPALQRRMLAIGSRLTSAHSAHVEHVPAAQGVMTVLFERIWPIHQLVIIGANPGAVALAHQGRLLGWAVSIIDQTPWPPAAGTQDDAFTQMTPSELGNRTFDRFTSVVAMTHNLEQDIAWLRALDTAPLRYLGVIGSHGRAAQLRRALPELHKPLHSPAGLDIGSETPAEIALAVTAEILTTATRRAGKHLAAIAEPVHA
jgi:xanthine/CO dehydrogenase XdhC/CoxF family maturation factor